MGAPWLNGNRLVSWGAITAWAAVIQRMVTTSGPRKTPAGIVGMLVVSTQTSLLGGTPARWGADFRGQLTYFGLALSMMSPDSTMMSPDSTPRFDKRRGGSGCGNVGTFPRTESR